MSNFEYNKTSIFYNDLITSNFWRFVDMFGYL